MANTAAPYRREGANSWQELLDQVNEELENPEPGCDALPPIEPPPADHIWSKEDIEEIHDRLNEMPGDCFEFESIPELWKLSIIEDIEDQLGEAWCDCGDTCCKQCSNAADEFDHFIGSEECCVGCDTPCPNDFCAGCQSNECSPLDKPLIDYLKWRSDLFRVCRLEAQIEELQEEIDDLQDEIDQLEEDIDQLEAALSECGPGASGDACRASIQAQIDEKEDEKEEKEDEKEEKEEEKQERESDKEVLEGQRDSHESSWTGLSDDLRNCWSSCCDDTVCGACLIDLLPDSNPAGGPSNCSCEEMKDQNFECDNCFGSCDTSWELQRQRLFTGNPNQQDFSTRYKGFYTYDDRIVAQEHRGTGCECAAIFRCCCTKDGGACDPGDCDPDDTTTCGPHPFPGPITYEVRIKLFPPRTFDDFNPEDGGPCDEDDEGGEGGSEG